MSRRRDMRYMAQREAAKTSGQARTNDIKYRFNQTVGGLDFGTGKALMEMKASFSNVANMLLDWDDVHNSDFCSWRGVLCDNLSLSVVSLDLQGNKLGGQIPDELGNCASLAYVDLARNQLTGEISRLLYWNEVLQYLDVRDNNLTGTIPDNIGNCTSYEILDLSDNELVGPIPPILGNLSFTGKLQLNDNELVGTIPPELGKLEQLFELNVHGNLLNGSIPLGFRNLGSLTYLDLSGNSFSGPIPLTLGDLEHLLIFDVSFNFLAGVIPTELGLLQNINSLILNNNKIHGKIPDQLTNCFSLVNLFIGNPFLCGDWVGSICGPPLPKSQVFTRTSVICMVLGFITLICMVVIAVYKSKQQKQVSEGSPKQSQGIGLTLLFIRVHCSIIDKALCGNLTGSTKLVILHMDMAIHTFDDIMRLTENLSEKFIIGYGASSTVYKCASKTSRPIAIKRIYNHHPHNLREFETELETIGSIRHRNIVSLHGYALSPFGNLLFYDYMENGSLWDLLHGPGKKVKLDWETRLKIAVGAAQGLAYLHHDCTPRIIHRDIKSSNILLDGNFEARLSDFGIAKSIPAAKTYASTYVLGTIGYIDPEYARTSRLNEKSDVYSFGIVLLELLTGKKAVDNEANLHQMILSKADDNTVMDAVDAEVSVTCVDSGHIKKTFQLALLCTKRNPMERPTMQEVARVLLSLLPSPPPKKPPSPAKLQGMEERRESHSSDTTSPQWFVQFREAISKSSL
ncbi:hypothetical protein Bca4012_012603 [Brassica carinata]